MTRDVHTVPARWLWRAGIGGLLGRAAALARYELDGNLVSLGLSSKHFLVLTYIDQSGPASQAMIGKELLIDRTTMVAVIDDLERSLLVSRTVDEQDRRAYRIHLTELGRQRLEEARAAACEADARMVSQLSPEDQAELRRLLLKLIE